MFEWDQIIKMGMCLTSCNLMLIGTPIPGFHVSLFCSAQDIHQIAVSAGNDVTLPCTSSNYPPWTGPELYNGNTQPYNNPGHSSFPNPNVPQQKRDRLNWDGDNSSLIIRDVILNDKGLYQCSIVAKIYLTVRGSASIQVPSAGNCREDTVLTCFYSGNIGRTGWFGLNRDIMEDGKLKRPEDQNNYTETRGQLSFTLTIHDTSLTDAGYYKCSNGWDESSLKRLNFECKASSAAHSVTRGKKLQITVDKLYPASPTFTLTFERQSNAIQISGSRTCTRSTQYSDYYRCVWTSSISLDDGLHTFSLIVTTLTQASPLTGSFKIELPLISNIVQLNDSREVLLGNESQSLTIQCTSNGGYPVQTVTWYINSISNLNKLATTSSGTLQSNGTYTVTLQNTFTSAGTDDRKSFICRSYYPQADSAQVRSKYKSVFLYLNLKPSQPTVTQPSVVSTGNDVTVRCTTTGSRPAASIIWLYGGVRYNGSTISTLDTITETFTVTSTYTRRVSAADNGQNIQCIVKHPALVSPSEITTSHQLSVNYPPNVSVYTRNASVTATNIKLACIAKGNPDSNFTYGQWVQRWPGYDVPVSLRPGSETLELTALTYEFSGYYTCTASNGIKVVGTNTDYVEAMPLELLVKSFPIIIRVDAKVASRLNQNLTFTIDYFSNVPGSDIKVYKDVNGEMKPWIIYSMTEDKVDIELPVFSHLIYTKGTKASIIIQIRSKEDFGSYKVVVSNEIGSSYKSFDVVMTEPPSTPDGFSIDYIQYDKARLSWKRGYSGGLAQTFVVQLGTDEQTWSDIEIYDDIKQDGNSISTMLTDLYESTTYFVRLYAYNDDGNSPLSETLNFTTAPVKETSNTTTTLIVGVVQGIINVALAVYAIYVTFLLKRRGISKQEGDSKQKDTQMYSNVADSMTVKTNNAGRRTNNQIDDVTNESQYTELDKELREPASAYDAISTI